MQIVPFAEGNCHLNSAPVVARAAPMGHSGPGRWASSRGCSKDDNFEARGAVWLRLVLRLLIAPLKLTRYSSENCTILLRQTGGQKHNSAPLNPPLKLK